MINFAVVSFESIVPVTYKEILVEDTLFDGVHVRIYHPPGKKEGYLRRAVVFIHGGGWSLGAPSMSQTMSF